MNERRGQEIESGAPIPPITEDAPVPTAMSPNEHKGAFDQHAALSEDFLRWAAAGDNQVQAIIALTHATLAAGHATMLAADL